jgi:dipeptidyl aminopeptidase/acylaminoacyl peptidase
VSASGAALICLLAVAAAASAATPEEQKAVATTTSAATREEPKVAATTSAATAEAQKLLAELKNYPYRIVHESYRDNRWALVVRNADGSNPVVLTRTPGGNETYPHVSPDGKKICFEYEEGRGKAKRRNVYLMNMDGSGRTRVAEAGRDPCWTPDGKAIVYLKDEVDELHYQDFATKGLFLYDLASGKTAQHVNHDLYHLYNVCCTADGNWFVSTVHAGMGCGHGILAIEAHGQGVYNLGIPGCRPDISADGKKIAGGAEDCTLRVADLEVVDERLKVTSGRDVVTSENPIHIYHIDWSPDSRYVAFSRGPTKEGTLGIAPEVVGVKAEGWNICVADASKTNRWVAITSDGKSNKEPDWFPAAK